MSKNNIEDSSWPHLRDKARNSNRQPSDEDNSNRLPRKRRSPKKLLGILALVAAAGGIYASGHTKEDALRDIEKAKVGAGGIAKIFKRDHSFKCPPPEEVSDSAKNEIADGSDFYAYDPRVPLKVDQWVFGAAQALPKKPFRFSYRIGGKVSDFSKNNGCVAFVPFENGSSTKDILGLEAAGRLVALECPSGRRMVLALGSNSLIQRKQVDDASKNSIMAPGLLWLPNEVAEKCLTPSQMDLNSSAALPIKPLSYYTRNGHKIFEASGKNLWTSPLDERR